MLPIGKFADALKVRACRFLIAALIALPSLCGAANITCAESPSPASPPPATEWGTPPPPAATESAATTTTTTVTRAPSPSDELNTLLMHTTFLIVGPTKVPGQISFGTVF